MIDRATGAQVLTVVLVVLPALIGPLERRFLRSDPSTSRKLAYYAFTIVYLWSFTAAAVWIFGVDRLRSAHWPGEVWLPLASISRPLVDALVAAYFVLGLMPLVQSLRGLRWRRAYAKAYRRHSEGFPGLLPETAVERFGFVLLSLTAGVCEEALYRGFLIRYLHESALAMPLLLALAVTSLAFGLGHLYQGGQAVLRIGLAGVGFGLLFLLSGSLIPGIVLHALIDVQVVYILRPLPDEDKVPKAPERATEFRT